MRCITDTFNRTAANLGNADTGQTWANRSTSPFDENNSPIGQVTSAWATNGATAATTDANTLRIDIATLPVGSADVDLAVDVSLPAAGRGAGLTFRWSSGTAFWTAFIYHSFVGAGYYVIVRKTVSSGSFSDLFVTHFAAESLSGAQRLRIVTDRAKISAYVGAVLVNTGSDAFNQTATHHGLMAYVAASSHFDNWSACPVGGWRVGSVGFG